MTYNLTALQNSTSFPAIFRDLNTSTGDLFIMGLLILVTLILFMNIYRTSGFKSAFLASFGVVTFLSALLYPVQLISQGFFMFYMTMTIMAAFIMIVAK